MPFPHLQINQRTGEPFIRLPEPHADIIITPPRLSDIESSVSIMNHPVVFRFMGCREEYTAEKAKSWIVRIKEASDTALQELKRGNTVVSGCPVRHIRQTMGDGTDVYIGDVGMERSNRADIISETERLRLTDENNSKKVGDPDIAWQVGYYLSPDYQGKGIMTAALNIIIYQWAIPHMNANRIRATAFGDNERSARVLQKSGFKRVNMIKDFKNINGELRDLQVFEWRKSC